MSTAQDNAITTAIAKTVAWFVAWLATVEMADVQAFVAIVSGMAVGALALTNWIFLIRDRLKGRKGK